MKNLGKIFSFTFVQQMKNKLYLRLTLIVTVLCVLLPAAILPAVEYFGDSEYYESKITKIYVIDTDEAHPADYDSLRAADESRFQNATYETAQSVEDAEKMASGEEYAAILLIEKAKESYQIRVLLPEGTLLERKDADAYKDYITEYFRSILVQKSGLDVTQIQELTAPISVSMREYTGPDSANASDETDEFAEMREVFSYLLPYLNIMILYFMILAYGQGTGNNVIMEKTTKLMDFFLVSVKPEEMLLGKVFGTAASGFLQLLCWIAGLTGGFAAGVYFVKLINPQTNMGLIQLIDTFGEMSGMFTISGAILACLILAAGLLLYCSLAAIGGAISEKPEDLSNANMLFVIILLFSFFTTLLAGGMAADVPWNAVTWQVWVPFTAVLVAPTKVLLGIMSTAQGLLSLALIVAAAVIITVIAGKLYRMMSLYKGNVPNPKQLIKMMREQ